MMLQGKTRSGRRSGFTLLEILIVVAIIVVVAGVGGYYLFGALDNGKISASKAQMKVIETAIESFRLNNNGPPQTLDVLLLPDPENGDNPYLQEPKHILDAWGNQFGYEYNDPRRPTLSFSLPSTGRVYTNRDNAMGNVGP